MYVSNNERSKLDAKIHQCIILGYVEDNFDYIFYGPIEKKLVRGRDVVFYEGQTIQDIRKIEETSKSSDISRNVDMISSFPLIVQIRVIRMVQHKMIINIKMQNKTWVIAMPLLISSLVNSLGNY